MNPIILIPARMASTRLPEKPLADIAGKPIIVHVMERATAAKMGPVWVACDDARIEQAHNPGRRERHNDEGSPFRLGPHF